MLKNRKGQSTVEYIILVTAVIAVIIFFVVKKDSPFQTVLNETLTTTTQDMVNMAHKIDASHNPKKP